MIFLFGAKTPNYVRRFRERCFWCERRALSTSLSKISDAILANDAKRYIMGFGE